VLGAIALTVDAVEPAQPTPLHVVPRA